MNNPLQNKPGWDLSARGGKRIPKGDNYIVTGIDHPEDGTTLEAFEIRTRASGVAAARSEAKRQRHLLKRQDVQIVSCLVERKYEVCGECRVYGKRMSFTDYISATSEIDAIEKSNSELFKKWATNVEVTRCKEV